MCQIYKRRKRNLHGDRCRIKVGEKKTEYINDEIRRKKLGITLVLDMQGQALNGRDLLSCRVASLAPP